MGVCNVCFTYILASPYYKWYVKWFVCICTHMLCVPLLPMSVQNPLMLVW